MATSYCSARSAWMRMSSCVMANSNWAKFGKGRAKKAYRVWCSWYSLFTAINEQILSKTFQALGDLPFDKLRAMPLDVLQVDDGWQATAIFPAGREALATDSKN